MITGIGYKTWSNADSRNSAFKRDIQAFREIDHTLVDAFSTQNFLNGERMLEWAWAELKKVDAIPRTEEGRRRSCWIQQWPHWCEFGAEPGPG